MSLFIGGLAFENVELDMDAIFDERLGIILGSLIKNGVCERRLVVYGSWD